jgi:Cu+-exporting ATPase
MDIAIANAAGRSDYNGQTYYFCSPGCKRDFDRDPEGVLKAEAEYDHSQPVEEMMGASPAPAGPAGQQRAWWQFWRK